MLDKIHWQEETNEITRCQSSKTKFTCEFGKTKRRKGQAFERAMNAVWGRNWSRREARAFILQAVEAVSEAVLRDGCVYPLEVVMVHGSARRPREPRRENGNILTVDFRRGVTA